MPADAQIEPGPSRRELNLGLAAVMRSPGLPAIAAEAARGPNVAQITCFIRYQIDPSQREAFRTYAETWGKIIPRHGGDLIGYFLPSEGTNDIGWGLIAFDSLAAYETYRCRLRADPEAKANFDFAQSRKVILREERTFLENVAGTIGAPTAAR